MTRAWGHTTEDPSSTVEGRAATYSSNPESWLLSPTPIQRADCCPRLPWCNPGLPIMNQRTKQISQQAILDILDGDLPVENVAQHPSLVLPEGGGEEGGAGNQQSSNQTIRNILSCTKCRFTTQRLGHLKQHELGKHGKKKFGCKMCRFKTGYQSALSRHKSAKHSEIKHKCPMCEYQTSRKDNLNSHMRIHTGNEEKFRKPAPAWPECPVCYDSMAPPSNIYQCMNGHKVCGACYPRLQVLFPS